MSIANKVLVKISLWCVSHVKIGTMGSIVHKHLATEQLEKLEKVI